MNRKGFTLAELLITIVILGIIAGLSVPVLRALQASQTEKKYTVYLDSVGTAAKLYTDSYSDDLFNGYTTGCTYIRYKDMSKYNLLKDIAVSGISCNTNYTFVKVVRFNDRFFYTPFIGCGTGTNGNIKASIFKPTKPTASSVCGTDAGKMISVVASPESSDSKTNKKISPIVSLVSETGVKNTPPVLDYGFSRENSINVINDDWTPLNFKIPKETVQEKLISEGTTQVFKSIGSLNTPMESGKFYLVIRVTTLENLERQPWQKVSKDSDRYVIFGPYQIDVTPPEFNDSRVISSSTVYNTKTPKLDLKVTDNLSEESDLRMCYAYAGDEPCPIPKDGEDLTKLTRYEAYNKNKILKKIANTFDGNEHDVTISVSDAAGNVSTQTYKYRVSKSYKLSFNTDGGGTCSAGGPINQIENKLWKENIVTNETDFSNHTFCKATKTGYTSDAWYTGKNGTGSRITGDSKATSNLTVYPNWTPKVVKVTFNCNGGSGGGEQDFTYGVSGQQFGKTCTRAGYKLEGWTLNDNGTIREYSIANGVSDAWIDAHAPSVTLKAKWSIITYTITYNLGGGEVSGNPATYNVNTETITLKNPTRENGNYIFQGWTGTGLSDLTKTVTIPKGSTGNRIYNANWNAKPIYITYKPNGGTGTMEQTKCYYGQNCTAAANKFTYNGYEFKAWYLNNAGTGDSIETFKATGDVTLYASWKLKTYKITYNLGGGTVSTANPTTYNMNTAEFRLNNPTKTPGYTFIGWTGTGLSSASTSVTVPKGSTGDRTYTATWDPKKVKVTYNCNGGTGGGSQTFTYGVSGQKFSSPCTPQAGYKQDGWNTKADGTGNSYSVNNGISDDWINTHSPEITLYARYSLANYTISYNLNGGSVTGNPASYNINTATFTLKNPTKAGNTFLGWTGTGISGSSTSVTVAKGSTGNRSYTATWDPKKITVTFTCNGGSGGGNQTFTYGVSGQSFNRPCTRVGYVQDGWTFNDNGTTRTYTNNNGVSNDWIDAHAPSATLVAKWKVATYTCSGGYYLKKTATSCTICPQNYYCPGGTFSYSATNDQGINPCPTGYPKTTSTGKKQASDCYMEVAANRHVKNARDTSSTACDSGQYSSAHTVQYGSTSSCSWPTYSITYYLNGGTASGNPSSYTPNTAAFTLRNPTKTGSTFAGWTGTGISGKSTSVTIPKGSTGNRSYTATWTVTPPSCTISLSSAANSNGWHNANVTLTLNRSGSDITAYGLATSANSTNGSTTATVSSNGTTTYYGFVRNSGGSASCSVTIKLDKTPPSCDGNSGGSTTWSNADSRTLKVDCKDNSGGSGCTKDTFSVKETSQVKTKSITITIKDKAGNTRDCTSTRNIYLDRTDPVYVSKSQNVSGNANWWLSTWKDSLSGLEPLGSGGGRWWYCYGTTSGCTKRCTTSSHDSNTHLGTLGVANGYYLRNATITTDFSNGASKDTVKCGTERNAGCSSGNYYVRSEIRVCDRAGNCVKKALGYDFD